MGSFQVGVIFYGGGAEDGFSGLKEAGVRTGEGVLFRLGLTGKQPEPSWRKPGERPD